MYYPYFRGKTYELKTIREKAPLMGTDIVPIIEPVRSSPKMMAALIRAVRALVEANIRFILVGNPRCGDFCFAPSPLLDDGLRRLLDGCDCWSVGCIADERSTSEEILRVCGYGATVAVIHDGYPSGRDLENILSEAGGITSHVFIDDKCSTAYRRRFPAGRRILIKNGFTQRINRAYPESEHFSDLHLTYRDEGMDGFGDFLVVGEDYVERGGPAYAVAIHLTYIDGDGDNDMLIRHYISDRSATPADPAGKFAEALSKLVADVKRRGSKILRSPAVNEFIRLHKEGHYPGLGYTKKLSMQHHLELVTDFLR